MVHRSQIKRQTLVSREWSRNCNSVHYNTLRSVEVHFVAERYIVSLICMLCLSRSSTGTKDKLNTLYYNSFNGISALF